MSESFKTGTLALYHSKLAIVRSLNGDKLEISIEGGGSKNVRTKDLEFVHSGPVNSFPDAVLPEPDLQEIAELMENETLSFDAFAELLYGEYSPAAAYSALLLLKDDLYFAGSITEGIHLKPAEEIRRKQEKLREKELEKQRYAERLERIRTRNLLPEDRPFMAEIEQVANGRNSASKLMKDLGIEAVPEKAHALLLSLGIWTYRNNPFPARADIPLESPLFPEEDVPEYDERTDLTSLTAYAIDDEGSNDPDDAVAYDAACGLIWVHVADPSSIVLPGSAMDNEARERGGNLYIPETVSHMMPEWMTDRFGLGLREKSPAMSFGIRIDDDGEAVLEKITLSTVHVERHTYQSAAELPLTELRAALERFRAKREQNHALFIRLPEVKLRVDETGCVHLRNIELTPERELVANAMLAAGSAVAKWAAEKEIPMPFVTQDDPEPVSENLSGLPLMYAMRKACQTGVTSSTAGRHAGLGLDPYVRVTSPLRRYCDLLAHQQIRKYLNHEELLDSSGIDEALAVSEDAAYRRKRLERLCNEYWSLIWMEQQAKQNGTPFTTEAVAVLHPDDRWFFLLPELAYEYKCRFGGKLLPGETIQLQLQKADPVRLTARMRIVFPGKDADAVPEDTETESEQETETSSNI